MCLFNENEKLQRQRVSAAVKSAIGHILCLYIYVYIYIYIYIYKATLYSSIEI